MERANWESELFYPNCLQQVQMKSQLKLDPNQGERLKVWKTQLLRNISFSQASRYFKKVSYSLSEDMKREFTQIMPIWKWAIRNLLQIARTYLVMKLFGRKKSGLRQSIRFLRQVIFNEQAGFILQHFRFFYPFKMNWYTRHADGIANK